MFKSRKTDLQILLNEAHDGTLQLPDFQRDFVWSDEAVRSLLASVGNGFPIGAFLTLQIGGSVRFKPRLLEGIPPISTKPSELLLDGQQRLTSLYQATFSKEPTRVRKTAQKEVERYYYIEILKAQEKTIDIEEVIVGVPSDRLIRTNLGREIIRDLSTMELEFENHMFPLNRVYDDTDWFWGYRDFWKEKGVDISEQVKNFQLGFIKRITSYEVPIIELDKKNTRKAICLVFEKVNVGGKKLDTFELLTAIYAADKFDLREDWNGAKKGTDTGRKARLIGARGQREVLREVASTEFLQVCSLLYTKKVRKEKEEQGLEGKSLPQVSCKRDAVLDLPLEEGYKAHAKDAERGVKEAGNFLIEQRFMTHQDIPYPPLVVGLATIFASLRSDEINAQSKQKISTWFWSNILGELLGSSSETRLARDVFEVLDWIRNIDNDSKPQALNEAVFQQQRLLGLRTRNSAAYKGLYGLLMLQGCQDFVTKLQVDFMTFFEDQIDIHHIFPKAWCQSQEVSIEPNVFNSIVNKTPLSARTNRFLGGDAPSIYLQKIQEKTGISPGELDCILRTHLIEPEHLRNDDFESFFDARLNALSDIIAQAMKKPVVREEGSDEVEWEIPDEEHEEFFALN